MHPAAKPPSWVTADFLYVRLIGDRALTQFDRIQRDLRHEMGAMRDRLLAEGASARAAFLSLNNHFTGTGPRPRTSCRR